MSRESQNREVLGIAVFGSFAKGKLHENSDIDVLLLKDGGIYLREIGEVDGLKLEVYRAPIEIFMPPFCGGGGRILFDMFRLQALRTGEIFYDPKRLLGQLRIDAYNSRIPLSYVKEMLNKAHTEINRAEDFLQRGRFQLAEDELFGASINVARALLLNENVPEINTPRLFLPHLRVKNPVFYNVFREIHELHGLDRSDVEDSLANLLGMLEMASGKLKEHWVSDLIEKAKTEALSAKDCLKNGDYESAMLQIRFSESILSHPSVKGLLKYMGFKNLKEAHLKNSSINENLEILKRIIRIINNEGAVKSAL
ncbi:nucleotidyltransferase domain-containing protein [Candidatus Bathyarchaeota archaeon]|nr:nucleotidyltransferase domain-containing protein [Candidatus Bathyarchaeota archaeon]